MKNRKIYTAEIVASVLGISKQTLIRYERKRIFPRPLRNPINKWREYSEEDINKLKSILGRRR